MVSEGGLDTMPCALLTPIRHGNVTKPYVMSGRPTCGYLLPKTQTDACREP
jgi:hypothetical protein